MRYQFAAKYIRLVTRMHIVVHDALSQIDAQQWNRLVIGNNPFIRHEFLLGLELSGCVSPDTGWSPQHIAIYDDQRQESLLGAMPCYLKKHSYGEYIFDWAWAEAHHRHGLDYYPKLSNAIPFTPATGPRWLVNNDDNLDIDTLQIEKALLQHAIKLTESTQSSSFHSLFVTKTQLDTALNMGLSQRSSTQFHWQNRGYASFAEFLNSMTSKKRKNIQRERRRVSESGIEYQWFSGASLDSTTVDTMYEFYLRTIHLYGAQTYLNQPFFQYIADHLPQQTHILFAKHADKTIAGGLFFSSDTTLYGRYWGALNNFHSVHFETCYYQPIEWCIQNDKQFFEAGAQGEHKLARGLEPCTTYSMHWISHPQFRTAIDDFLSQESNHVKQYQDVMHTRSPFKSEI